MQRSAGLLHKKIRLPDTLFSTHLRKHAYNSGYKALHLTAEYPITASHNFFLEWNVGEKFIRTAIREIGYCRRTSKKKGFFDDPRVWDLRKAFAQEAITWTREMLSLSVLQAPDQDWVYSQRSPPVF